MVVLVTGLLAALATPLGPLLRSMAPLRAYAIDVIGSLCGIAVFVTLSASGTDPLVWFGVAVFLVLLMELGAGFSAWSLVSVVALAAVLLLVNHDLGPVDGRYDTYSPYYRINLTRYSDGQEHLRVNGIPHQALHRLGAPGWEPFYEQLYEWFPGRTYDEVLVVGAGSGSDVALALERGAGHIDAVEIDPVIQRIGIERHPDRPYEDPRVSRFVNDGRAFLANTDKRYDLVRFALPDSLTLVSNQANVRLESFLFTEEAFESVAQHLSEDGVFVLYNYYREPWLVAKLATMLEAAFGHRPLLRTYDQVMATLAAGPAVAALAGTAPPGDGVDPVPVTDGPGPSMATDDWPFLYLRTPFVAPYYLVALGFVLLGALFAVFFAARFSGTTMRRFSPHFFVLGTAFLLLETRSLVSFSLLFGSTWLVNALAFFGILMSVLLAILVNARLPDPPSVALLRGAPRVPRGGLAGAARIPPLRPLLAAIRGRRRPRVRPRLLRQSRVHLVLPRHAHGRHGLRQQPAGSDGRRRARVPRARDRLSGAAASRRHALPGCLPARDALALPGRSGAGGGAGRRRADARDAVRGLIDGLGLSSRP